MVQSSSAESRNRVQELRSRTEYSYFVVMRDFPAQRAREAVVDPEMTRRNVIDRIASREYENVLFVHEIADGCAIDITDDVMAAAFPEEDEPSLSPVDRQAARWDYERDLRKHEVV